MKSSKKDIDNAESAESEMEQKPIFERAYDRQDKKLVNKVAIVTGGDSGIGRAICVAFAREGANVAIVYRKDSADAKETRKLVEEKGTKAIIVGADISIEKNCQKIINKVIKEWGRIDILVNNAAVQYPQTEIENIKEKQLLQTFRTNIFSQIFLVQAALPHLKEGSAIINTTSVTAYRGNPYLLDYSATKGAIVSFTRSLSGILNGKKIRVNAVAPGPIWTPLITTTFPDESLDTFGKDTPMQRAGQPAEVAPAYVFLASEDASYITGQVIHVNGGEIVNG
ncbi:SDR family oxidoreductase [Emticicia sp. BO119]|uniref:SDR family oxidoreductase n=1 Tax=Emticicia sp. BO119 TaxID=2757768 RepID=UPI0015F011BF|nr:SDR family oxidoreductase [Emticicia sp. BO119]MBA4852769.1 SDR family oxidoreductase [Emticicia sp. BO119]